MKTSPTALMKELKFIEKEIKDIHSRDENYSTVEVDEKYQPLYENDYDYEANRTAITELRNRERAIKQALAKFNVTTNVDGYDITIAEALVKLGQLKEEIKVLSTLSNRTQFQAGRYSSDRIFKTSYDLSKAKADLKKLTSELYALQIAVDKTNLNSSIDF